MKTTVKSLRDLVFPLLSLLCLVPLSHAQSNRPSGTVVTWGDRFLPYVEPGARFTAISAGAQHTVALTSAGAVVAWGYDGQGQARLPVTAQSGVVAIAAGGYHTVALKTNGSVVAWGNPLSGQAKVSVAAQSGVVAVAAGGKLIVALKSNGSVVAWGDGQSLVPGTAKSGVVAIAVGGNHAVALKTNGVVVAWGNSHVLQSVVPGGLRPTLAIAAGGSSTVAIVRDPVALLNSKSTRACTRF